MPEGPVTSAPVDVTVAICTRNRAESLALTLQSLAAVTVPEALRVELLVVDNGSTDDTARVAQSFTWAVNSVRHLFVPAPGLAAARAHVLEQARGAIIAFTDDDVRFPTHWLAELIAPIASGEADAVGGGIRIPAAVRLPTTRPHHEEWFASTEYWEPTREPVLVGASMAIRASALRAIGFDPELQQGEDTLLSYRLMAQGYRIVLRHDVVVEHHLDRQRLTRAGIERQARARGRAQAFFAKHWYIRLSRFPRIRLIEKQMRLAWVRLTGWRADPNDISLEEMRLRQWIAYYREVPRVRGQRQRYDPVSGRRIDLVS